MARLPPDDLPPEHEPTSEVDALVAAGLPGPDNPVTVGAVFWTAVTEPDGPDLDILSIVVTPESWPGWGDFGRAAALLPGYGMAHQVTPSVGDPDVVYVRYLRDTGEALRAPSDTVLVGDIVIATLVRRRASAAGASTRSATTSGRSTSRTTREIAGRAEKRSAVTTSTWALWNPMRDVAGSRARAGTAFT